MDFGYKHKSIDQGQILPRAEAEPVFLIILSRWILLYYTIRTVIIRGISYLSTLAARLILNTSIPNGTNKCFGYSQKVH